MQELLMIILPLAIFAIGVGILSSMVGIGGGIINTPLLILVFAFSAQESSATALVAAMFVAISSTWAYSKQKPLPIVSKVGLLMALATAPGSWLGVMLREIIAEDYALRFIFGISLFPVALKMLFAKRKGKGDLASEMAEFDLSSVSRQRIVLSLFGGLIGGIAAGLLGIGGGAIVVPVLSIIVGLPMHAAVATSMFTMMFTAGVGSFRNFIGGHIMLELALVLGFGMIIGAQFGSRLACRVNAAQLKRIFGLILVFPLVKMMKLGELWLDPMGTNFMIGLAGDILIWLLVVVPIGLLRFYQLKKQPIELEPPPLE